MIKECPIKQHCINKTDRLFCENMELKEALKWASYYINKPTQKIKGQNEDYFEGYEKFKKALELLEINK